MRPELSAMFSPSVSSPFTWYPGTASKAEYWSTSILVFAVDRLAELVGLAVFLEGACAHHVADQVVAADLDRRIVDRAFRVTDLRVELGELVECALARLGPHPRQLDDALAVRGEQVRNHLVHAGLAAGRELLL